MVPLKSFPKIELISALNAFHKKSNKRNKRNDPINYSPLRRSEVLPDEKKQRREIYS
jgi:hypothetical protein